MSKPFQLALAVFSLLGASAASAQGSHRGDRVVVRGEVTGTPAGELFVKEVLVAVELHVGNRIRENWIPL
jgi:hypothetical protein